MPGKIDAHHHCGSAHAIAQPRCARRPKSTFSAAFVRRRTTQCPRSTVTSSAKVGSCGPLSRFRWLSELLWLWPCTGFLLRKTLALPSAHRMASTVALSIVAQLHRSSPIGRPVVSAAASSCSAHVAVGRLAAFWSVGAALSSRCKAAVARRPSMYVPRSKLQAAVPTSSESFYRHPRGGKKRAGEFTHQPGVQISWCTG